MTRHRRTFPGPARRLGLALFGAAAICAAGCAGPQEGYGGAMVNVRVRIEPPGEVTEPSVAGDAGGFAFEGWVLDMRAWRTVEGRDRLSQLAHSIEAGRPAEAEALRTDLLADMSRESLASVRRQDSELRLPATTLYLVVRNAEALAWKSFDSLTERTVVLQL